MSKRFTVKEIYDTFFVMDTLADERVNSYDNYDDALNDAKCRNDDEDKYGDE